MAPHLIGRETELDLLDQVAHRVTTGLGSVVCIIGEPGIGKTSLLGAARERLAGVHVDLHSAALDPTDRRRTLAVVRSLVPGRAVVPGDDPVDAAIAAVERMAAVGPVGLLVDDLHWADDASVDVLSSIARRAEALGVVVAATTRPQPSGPPLLRFQELASNLGVCLRPDPLAEADLALMVTERLGAVPGPRLAEELAATAGNPFLAAELVSGLVQDGQMSTDEGVAELSGDVTLPSDLSGRLAARAFAAVPGGDLLLRALAAVPGGATAEELAELLDAPFSQVVASALAAVDAGVLVDGGTALIFRHDLLRRSLLDTMPCSIVRTLSRRAAELLTTRHADPERITVCLLEGADPADPGDVERLLSAGRAFRPTHPGAAADLLASALHGLDPRHAVARQVVLDLGWALVEAGRAGEVEALLDARVGPFRIDEPLQVQRLRGIAASLTGRLDRVAAKYADTDLHDVVLRHDRADAEAVDAVAELAQLRVSMGRMAEAAEILEWVAAASAPQTALRTVTVASVRSLLAATTGRFEEAAAWAREGVDAAERDSSGLVTAAPSRLALAIALDHMGDGDGALAVVRDRAARRSMARWGPPLLQFFAAVTLYRRGDWDDALAEVEAGLRAAEEADMGMAGFWPPSVGALICSARGDSGAAHRWIELARGAEPSVGLGREWLALAVAMTTEADGDPAAAVEVVAYAAERILEADAPTLLLNGGPDMVRLCLSQGRAELAGRIAATISVVTTRTASPVATALAGWVDGLVRDDGAPIATAAEALASMPRLPESARAWADAAVVSSRFGAPIQARQHAKRAFALFDSLGAEQWWRRLRSDLRPAGLEVRPRRGPRRASTGWGSLTASEETIVSMVGEGLTNTEIAARLVVSRRTVESHLGRVYTKLEFSSRAQLVAAAARRHQEVEPGPRPDTRAGAR